MDVKLTLSTLEQLIEQMQNAELINRVTFYTSIKVLINGLTEYVDNSEEYQDSPTVQENFHIYLSEMTEPLSCAAGLLDHEYDDSQIFSWLHASIKKLKSVHCFNI